MNVKELINYLNKLDPEMVVKIVTADREWFEDNIEDDFNGECEPYSELNFRDFDPDVNVVDIKEESIVDFDGEKIEFRKKGIYIIPTEHQKYRTYDIPEEELNDKECKLKIIFGKDRENEKC